MPVPVTKLIIFKALEESVACSSRYVGNQQSFTPVLLVRTKARRGCLGFGLYNYNWHAAADTQSRFLGEKYLLRVGSYCIKRDRFQNDAISLTVPPIILSSTVHADGSRVLKRYLANIFLPSTAVVDGREIVLPC